MRLFQMATGIDVKNLIFSDVCGDCMKKRQQRRFFRMFMKRFINVLNEIHNDLKKKISIFSSRITLLRKLFR